MRSIPITSILVWSDHDAWSIDQHPYYTCLKRKDPQIYKNYLRKSSAVQRKKKSGNWNGYIRLVQSIYKSGFQYNSEDPIILKYKNHEWRCHHGRHRICILKYLFGSQFRVVVKRKNDTSWIVTGIRKIQ